MPYVNVNNTNMYYETRGRGPAVLLVSGLGTDLNNWPVLSDRLAEDHTVVAFDNQGAGRSSMPEPPYAVADMAADALGLMDALGLETAHVLGHSMGGFIAIEMALAAPERVGQMVLACTAARMPGRGVRLLENWLAMAQGGVAPDVLVREVFLWMYAPGRYEEPGFLDNEVAQSLAYPHQQPLHAFAGQVAAINAFDASDRLGDVRSPALVLGAEHDLLITRREARFLCRGLPDAREAVVPDAGHRVNLERPEAFAARVAEFFSGG